MNYERLYLVRRLRRCGTFARKEESTFPNIPEHYKMLLTMSKWWNAFRVVTGENMLSYGYTRNTCSNTITKLSYTLTKKIKKWGHSQQVGFELKIPMQPRFVTKTMEWSHGPCGHFGCDILCNINKIKVSEVLLKIMFCPDRVLMGAPESP